MGFYVAWVRHTDSYLPLQLPGDATRGVLMRQAESTSEVCILIFINQNVPKKYHESNSLRTPF